MSKTWSNFVVLFVTVCLVLVCPSNGFFWPVPDAVRPYELYQKPAIRPDGLVNRPDHLPDGLPQLTPDIDERLSSSGADSEKGTGLQSDLPSPYVDQDDWAAQPDLSPPYVDPDDWVAQPDLSPPYVDPDDWAPPTYGDYIQEETGPDIRYVGDKRADNPGDLAHGGFDVSSEWGDESLYNPVSSEHESVDVHDHLGVDFPDQPTDDATIQLSVDVHRQSTGGVPGKQSGDTTDEPNTDVTSKRIIKHTSKSVVGVTHQPNDGVTDYTTEHIVDVPQVLSAKRSGIPRPNGSVQGEPRGNPEDVLTPAHGSSLDVPKQQNGNIPDVPQQGNSKLQDEAPRPNGKRSHIPPRPNENVQDQSPRSNEGRTPNVLPRSHGRAKQTARKGAKDDGNRQPLPHNQRDPRRHVDSDPLFYAREQNEYRRAEDPTDNRLHQQRSSEPSHHGHPPLSPDWYGYPSHHLHYSQPKTCTCNCNNYPHTLQEPEPSCEWVTVFKAVAGSDTFVIGDYFDPFPTIELYTSPNLASPEPYKDFYTFEMWEYLPIHQIKLEVFAEGERKAWFVFNGVGTNVVNWMTNERLIASNYNNIKLQSFVHFGVDTDTHGIFVIIEDDTDCASRCGYLEVVPARTTGDACTYEDIDPEPVILYSLDDDLCADWQTAGEFGYADRLLVSVKVCDAQW